MTETSSTALQGYNFAGSKYGNEKRRQAVVVYLVEGTISKTSRVTRIPQSTLRDWRKEEWFDLVSVEVRAETNDQIRADYTAIIQEGNRVALEGLKAGDVKPKDAIIMSAVAFDKRQLLDNMPTNITQSEGSRGIQAKLEEISRRLTEQERIDNAKVVSEQSSDDSQT